MPGELTLQLKPITRGNVYSRSALILLALSLVIFIRHNVYATGNISPVVIVENVSGFVVGNKQYCNQNDLAFVIPDNKITGIHDQKGNTKTAIKPQLNANKHVDNSVVPAAISSENARVLILTENINSAIVIYARLISKDSTNVSLNSEYAYALALGGIYDAALARLDRFWSRKANNTDADYFASQIFILMGYDQLASEFWKQRDVNKTPSWISAKANVLSQKYKRRNPEVSEGRDELVNRFKRANRLAAQNYTTQSLALFEEITTQYTNEYLLYVGYSIALEKAGLFEKSARMLENALDVIGNSQEQKETKEFLNKRLSTVRLKINSTGLMAKQEVTPAKAGEGKIRPMMAYTGGMIYSNYLNLNARYGYFLSKTGNLSLNFGVTINSGNTYSNLGLLYYQRHKIFVVGFGLSSSFGNGSSTMYAKLSPGLSIMNKNKSASWDIFWDVQVPFSNKYATTAGFSIGRSFYFGNRNQSK